MFRKVLVLVGVALLAGCSSHHRDEPNIQPPRVKQVQPTQKLTGKQAALNAWEAFNSGGPLTSNTKPLTSFALKPPAQTKAH